LATRGMIMVHFTFHEAPVPNEVLVTGVVVVAFVQEKCLMVSVRQRPGFAFVSGHIDSGESPEQAASREVKEEADADIVGLRRIGYVLCHNDDKPIPPYPFPDSYLVVFAARCSKDGVGKDLVRESTGVLVCHPDEVSKHLGFNVSLYLQMLAEARKQMSI
jgi:8-oxo-dGTP pyrophosphatase MutT (NUDIX family)